MQVPCSLEYFRQGSNPGLASQGWVDQAENIKRIRQKSSKPFAGTLFIKMLFFLKRD